MAAASSHHIVLPRTRFSRETALIFGLLAYVLLVGFYFTLRYAGHWAENDTAFLAQASRAVINQDSLEPSVGVVYQNGFGFQAVSAYLSDLTGLSIADLYALAYPLLATLMVIPLYYLYREFTPGPWVAALGTFLVYLQSESMFVLLRGSHEKFSRPLLILALLFLVRSVKQRDNPRAFAIYVTLFYVFIAGLLSYNAFFGSSLSFALAIALLGAMLTIWRSRQRSNIAPLVRRFAYASVTCAVLTFVFMTYLYAPATSGWLLLRDEMSKVTTLLFGAELPFDPYGAVGLGWTNVWVYLAVSATTWLIFAWSLALWLRRTWRWLRHGKSLDLVEGLVWLLYLAFAVQGALSVAGDYSGMFAGNLEVRIFPSFVVAAVAVIVKEAGDWLAGLRWHQLRLTMLALLAACLVVAALLKTTNEPMLSNKWVFYLPSEMQALNWSDAHLQTASIWTDFDERLSTAFDLTHGPSLGGNVIDIYTPKPETRAFLITDINRLRSARLNQPLPISTNDMIVYDNGAAQLYRRVAVTPYQR